MIGSLDYLFFALPDFAGAAWTGGPRNGCFILPTYDAGAALSPGAMPARCIIWFKRALGGGNVRIGPERVDSSPLADVVAAITVL